MPRVVRKQVLKLAALAGLAAAMAMLLTGCMLDPVSIVLGASNAAAMASLTPEDVGATPAAYRGYDCGMLKNTIDSFEQQKRQDSDPRVWQWHIDAMRQVQAEQRCDGATAPATTLAAAAPAALDSPTRGVLGVRMEPLTAPVAEALGLNPPRGVLAVEILPGSGADQAGLKPMDVILEIAGQPVQNPVELQAIVSRMRAGYRAPLQVWRARQLVEVEVEVKTAAALEAALAGATAIPTTTPAAAGPQVAKYCHALMQWVGKPGAVRSRVWEDTTSYGGEAARIASLDAFIAYVQAAQPGVWHDFPQPTCYAGSNDCTAQAVRHFGGTSQLAMLFCSTDPAAATASWNQLAGGEGEQRLPWPAADGVGSPANLRPLAP